MQQPAGEKSKPLQSDKLNAYIQSLPQPTPQPADPALPSSQPVDPPLPSSQPAPLPSEPVHPKRQHPDTAGPGSERLQLKKVTRTKRPLLPGMSQWKLDAEPAASGSTGTVTATQPTAPVTATQPIALPTSLFTAPAPVIDGGITTYPPYIASLFLLIIFLHHCILHSTLYLSTFSQPISLLTHSQTSMLHSIGSWEYTLAILKRVWNVSL